MRARPCGLAVSTTLVGLIVSLLVPLAGPAERAAAANRSTTKPKTTTAKRVTTKKATRVATPTTRKPAGAAPATTAPATATPTSIRTVTVVVPAPAPITTAPSPTAPPATLVIAPAATEPVTSAPTTTALPNDFTIRLASPAKTAAPGDVVSFVIIVEPKTPGRAVPATIIVTGLPGGVTATLEPNPITTAGELRVQLPSSMPLGFYDLRITGNAAGITHSVVATLMVTGTSATVPAATTTTTAPPTGNAGFSITVVSPSDRLRTGGTLSFPISIRSVNGFSGTVTFSVASLPAGVWAGFSDNPATASSTMWLSSSVPLVAGTYAFNLVATSGSATQLVPLVVVLA